MIKRILHRIAWHILTQVFRENPGTLSYSARVKGENYTILRLKDYLENVKK